MKREPELSNLGKQFRSPKVAVLIYFVGTALIIAGQSVYRYANQTISDLEAKLSQPELSQNEYWDIDGSLDWWRPALVSTFGPISIYLIAAGIAVLAFLTAYAAFTILRSKQNQKH